MRGRKQWVPVLAAALLLVGCGALRGPEKFEKTALYFDTVIQITFYARENGAELMERCMQICEEAQETFSRTDAGSELYAVNHRSADRVEVSEELAELVALGLEYYELSGGKFDITVAPLSDLWDFQSEDARVPDQADIAAALAKVDAGKVHVEGNTLVFDDPDTMLDLGALAKGFAADRIGECLRQGGVTSGLINLGGNVLTIGARPDGKKWRIGVQKPFAAHGETVTAVEAEDQSVVSSGVYERFFEQDGTIYHHILDPDTGYPVENEIDGVTIRCGSSLQGDALSTVCLAVGVERAREILEEVPGAEAVFVTEDGELICTDESMRQ